MTPSPVRSDGHEPRLEVNDTRNWEIRFMVMRVMETVVTLHERKNISVVVLFVICLIRLYKCPTKLEYQITFCTVLLVINNY